MTDIVLDSMIRIPVCTLTGKQLSSIRRVLTLRTPDSSAFGFGGSTEVACFEEDDDYISVPRNWPSVWPLLERRGFHDLRSRGHPIDARFNGAPRRGQERFVGLLQRAFRQDDELGAIGQAPVGFGKTVVAVMLACLLRRTTLFVAHKEELCRQFIAACEKFTGQTPGWIQSDTCDYEGKDFCVAMIQSLFQRNYPADFYNYFGLVIFDEAHRVSAPTFSAAASRMNSRWRLGLTATPRRADQLEDVFHWHIGEVRAVGRGDHLDCSVFRVIWDPNLDPSDYSFRGRPSLSRAITLLTQDSARTSMLVSLMLEAARKGRRLLVLSHRVQHIEDMMRRLERALVHEPEITVGFYRSGNTNKVRDEREIAKACQITLATEKMAAEGLDIPDKDTLILTTPIADPEQACGRIRRLYANKKDPVIVDVYDKIPFMTGIHRKRRRYYETPGLDKQSWTVKQVRRFAS